MCKVCGSPVSPSCYATQNPRPTYRPYTAPSLTVAKIYPTKNVEVPGCTGRAGGRGAEGSSPSRSQANQSQSASWYPHAKLPKGPVNTVNPINVCVCVCNTFRVPKWPKCVQVLHTQTRDSIPWMDLGSRAYLPSPKMPKARVL